MFEKLKKLFSVEQEQPEKDLYEKGCNLIDASDNETNPEKKQKLFTQGHDIILREAENGDVRAMNVLSYIYTYGKYLPPEPEKAYYWDVRSAKAGDPTGMMNFGDDYRYGFGTEKDIQQAIYWYMEAAKHSIEAAKAAYCKLAELYDDSGEIPADEEKAIQYMQMYGEATGSEAEDDPLLNFATYYRYNYNDKCIKWYEKSINAGNVLANIGYGCLLFTGLTSEDKDDENKKIIIPRDTKKAKYYLEQAAVLGSSLGMGLLAQMYANGVGTDIDLDAANMWYQKTLDQGGIMEQYALGLDLFAGRDDFAKNIPLAVEFLANVLEPDTTNDDEVFLQAEALVILGCIYATEPSYQNASMVEILTGVKQQNGIIDPQYQNIPMAEMLWNEAGKMGLPEAYFNLGVLYSRGDLVPPNHQLANEYFSKSDELYEEMVQAGNSIYFKHVANADKTKFIFPYEE